jgi:hypothetical protein
MEIDSNGLKYYLNHQVWKPGHDMRGLGGDQINMALSSWTLLYGYSGDTSVIKDMRYMADYYLAHSLSPTSAAWPSLPYPYNLKVHSGEYDGDMRAGKGILQPDKAANFGFELINLYKITGDTKYLSAAKNIALTLSKFIKSGDGNISPLPFRVDAKTGKTGSLLDNNGSGKITGEACYTSNWSGLLMMFQQLIKLDKKNIRIYQHSFETVLSWMQKYPMKTNKWGPFFEDIPGWSDTQINAVTFATFILLNQNLFPDWKKDVKGILEWTHKELSNHEYEKFHVTVMNEQTVYKVPGNSHSSRQASVELWYAEQSGDTSYNSNAIRILSWATYTVAGDGRNKYIRDDIWLTDGYGDYIRHYIRAMAANPALAPANKNRLIRTSSVITHIQYANSFISYNTFDPDSKEIFRLKNKPVSMQFDSLIANENIVFNGNKWTWTSLTVGGILTVQHSSSNYIKIVLN